MVGWISEASRQRHFREHGREVGAQSIDRYDESVQWTLDNGRFFEFFHEDAGEFRTGCYHRETGLFVVLNLADAVVTHYVCPEWYVEGLSDNNYDPWSD